MGPALTFLIMVSLIAPNGIPIANFEWGAAKDSGLTFVNQDECEKARHSDTFVLALDDYRFMMETRLRSPFHIRTKCGHKSNGPADKDT
jgi:hypothetical protein